MNTIDKLRSEIERMMDEYKPMASVDELTGAHIALAKLLSFLDTLEEPVGKTCKTCGFYENNCPFIRGKFISYPNKVCKDYTFSTLKAEQELVSENLEEEIDRVIADYAFTKTINSGGFKTTVLDYEKIARYFAEWGAEHLRDSTKKINDDLEEAARECSKTIYNKPLSGNPQEGYIVYDPDKYNAFKAGAEWQARQLLKSSPLPEDTVIFQNGVQEGRRLEREDALSIADIEKLHTFLYAVKNNKHGAFTFTRLSDEQYEEVLRRFNKTKEQ